MRVVTRLKRVVVESREPILGVEYQQELPREATAMKRSGVAPGVVPHGSDVKRAGIIRFEQHWWRRISTGAGQGLVQRTCLGWTRVRLWGEQTCSSGADTQ